MTTQQSPQEMLRQLRELRADLQCRIRQMQDEVNYADRCKETGAVGIIPRNIDDYPDFIQTEQAELAALEQAIRVLEVLTHPDFRGVTSPTSEFWRARAVTNRTPDGAVSIGCDRREAVDTILAAHPILYPTEQKGEST